MNQPRCATFSVAMEVEFLAFAVDIRQEPVPCYRIVTAVEAAAFASLVAMPSPGTVTVWRYGWGRGSGIAAARLGARQMSRCALELRSVEIS